MNAAGGRNNIPCNYCGIPGHSTNSCFKRRQMEFETENKKLQTQIESLQKAMQEQNQTKNVRVLQSTKTESENNSSTNMNSLMNRHLAVAEQRKVPDYSHLLPNNVTVIQACIMATADRNRFHNIEKIMLCQIEGVDMLLSPLNDTGADISIVSLDVAKKYKLTIHQPDDENIGIRVADTRILLRIGYVTIKTHILFPNDDHRQTIEIVKKFEVMETAIPFIFGTDLLPIIFPNDDILKYVPKSRSISLVPIDVKYLDSQLFNPDSLVWLDKTHAIKFRELSTQDKCLMSMNTIDNVKVTYVNMTSLTNEIDNSLVCELTTMPVSIEPHTEKDIITTTQLNNNSITDSHKQHNNNIEMSSQTPQAINVIKCSSCPLRTFRSESDFQAHVKAVHVQGKMKCFNCNYWFDNKQALDTHKLKDNCTREEKLKKKQESVLRSEPLSVSSNISSQVGEINTPSSLNREQSIIECCQHCHQRHFISYRCNEEIEAAHRIYQNLVADKQVQDQKQRQREEEQKRQRLHVNVPILTPWEEYLRSQPNVPPHLMSSLPSTPLLPQPPTSYTPLTPTLSQQTTPIFPSPQLPTPILHVLPPQLQSQRSEITMDDVFDLEEWFRDKGIAVLVTRQNFNEMREQRRMLVGDARPLNPTVPTITPTPQRHGSRMYHNYHDNNNNNNNNDNNGDENDDLRIDKELISPAHEHRRHRSRETGENEGRPTQRIMCRFKSGCTHADCQFRHPQGWSAGEAQRQRLERSRSPRGTDSSTSTTTSTTITYSTSPSTSIVPATTISQTMAANTTVVSQSTTTNTTTRLPRLPHQCIH